MASSDDSVPEPVSEKLETGPTETPLPPEEAKEIVDEIKAVAESRGEDSEVIEKLDLEIPPTGPHPIAPVLEREDAEEFFISLSAHDQATLILHFRPGQRRQWMRLLEPDDVADVIQEAGEEHKAALLALLDVPTRKEVTALLAYEEDEAGGLMSTRYARLRPQMTADEAISFLR